MVFSASAQGRVRIIAGIALTLSIATQSCSFVPQSNDRSIASLSNPMTCPGLQPKPFRSDGTWIQPGLQKGAIAFPGVTFLTGFDLKTFQTEFCNPELADPYVTALKDSALISGTAQFYFKFASVDDIARGGPYQIIWNDYYYPDGTPMEGDRYYAHSWDMKPAYWAQTADTESPRLWDASKDTQPPTVVWYGGHMRPRLGQKISYWPDDNFSRDVFAFTEKTPGHWYSQTDSIFSRQKAWPRTVGNFLGHRYGHQIVMVPKAGDGSTTLAPSVFYEEVTRITANGSPSVTQIFMDEMANPLQAQGKPTALISPFNPSTGKPYPSTIREDGSVLVEGPLYFRFLYEGEAWEAIGFSAGSFYGNYPSAFASRKVSDGLQGKPYQLDLTDDGSDLHNAGAGLGSRLNLAGGPGRPAVIVDPNGMAILGSEGRLQLLVHAYRKDILPDNDYSKFPTRYRLDQMYRAIFHAYLKVERPGNGPLRFTIQTPTIQTSKF